MDSEDAGRSRLILIDILFTDDHVLNFDSEMISEDECGLNFLTYLILEENLNQEIDPTGNRTRDSWVRGNDIDPRKQR